MHPFFLLPKPMLRGQKRKLFQWQKMAVSSTPPKQQGSLLPYKITSYRMPCTPLQTLSAPAASWSPLCRQSEGRQPPSVIATIWMIQKFLIWEKFLQRGKFYKLESGRFRLAFLTVMLAQHWNRLPRKTVLCMAEGFFKSR